MTIRQWLTSAALSAGLGLGAVMPAFAAEKKVEFTFGSLQAVSTEAAKTKPSRGSRRPARLTTRPPSPRLGRRRSERAGRTLATLEMGSADAKKISRRRPQRGPGSPKAVPALLKDAKQDKFLRANLVLGFAAT